MSIHTHTLQNMKMSRKKKNKEALGYLEGYPKEKSPVAREDDAVLSPFGSFFEVDWQPHEEVRESLEEPMTTESRVRLIRMNEAGITRTWTGNRGAAE